MLIVIVSSKVSESWNNIHYASLVKNWKIKDIILRKLLIKHVFHVTNFFDYVNSKSLVRFITRGDVFELFNYIEQQSPSHRLATVAYYRSHRIYYLVPVTAYIIGSKSSYCAQDHCSYTFTVAANRVYPYV